MGESDVLSRFVLQEANPSEINTPSVKIFFLSSTEGVCILYGIAHFTPWHLLHSDNRCRRITTELKLCKSLLYPHFTFQNHWVFQDSVCVHVLGQE